MIVWLGVPPYNNSLGSSRNPERETAERQHLLLPVDLRARLLHLPHQYSCVAGLSPYALFGQVWSGHEWLCLGQHEFRRIRGKHN
jgi:hypothetical protein